MVSNSAADALAGYAADIYPASAEILSFYLNDNAVLVQVPQPASLALSDAGLIGLGWIRRRYGGHATA